MWTDDGDVFVIEHNGEAVGTDKDTCLELCRRIGAVTYTVYNERCIGKEYSTLSGELTYQRAAKAPGKVVIVEEDSLLDGDKTMIDCKVETSSMSDVTIPETPDEIQKENGLPSTPLDHEPVDNEVKPAMLPGVSLDGVTTEHILNWIKTGPIEVVERGLLTKPLSKKGKARFRGAETHFHPLGIHQPEGKPVGPPDKWVQGYNCFDPVGIGNNKLVVVNNPLTSRVRLYSVSEYNAKFCTVGFPHDKNLSLGNP
jgi:hypothetical protein